MPKLPELLAVQGTLRGQAHKVLADLSHTFEKKTHLFEGKLSTFEPYAESETLHRKTEESRDLQTTVVRELAWIAPIIARAWDTDLQVDTTNLHATADVVLEDGSVLCKGVPLTALLSLEKTAEQIHLLIGAIPTLDPAKDFTPDPQKGTDVMMSREIVKVRTEKIVEPITLLEPTKEHPGKAELITRDKPVGALRGREWSGLITPAQKSAMLERSEEFKRAISQARMRANDREADTSLTIGARALAFVFTNARPA